MKKKYLTAVCGLLATAMLFAACNKADKNSLTTTQDASSALESTTREATLLTLPGTSATKKTTTTKKVTTTKKKSSSNKSSGSNKKNVGSNHKPNVDVPSINTDKLDPNFKDTEFKTLSELKNIAKSNRGKDGMDMFRDGKIIYAPFSLNGSELYGTVTKNYLDTYCSFYDEEDPSKECNVFYRTIMQRTPSHKLSDLLGSQAGEYTSFTYKGKTYYYQTAKVDGEYGVAVLSFVGDYICMAGFAGTIDPDEYGIAYFLDISNFTSITI